MSSLNFLKQSRIYPILVLENWLSETKRQRLLRLFRWLIVFLGLLIVVYLIAGRISGGSSAPWLSLLGEKMFGLLLVALAGFLAIFSLEAYFTSVFYSDLIIKNEYQPKDLYTFSAGRILYQAPQGDILLGFLSAPVGQLILGRLGLSVEKIALARPTGPVASGWSIDTDERGLITLATLVLSLYKNEPVLTKALSDRGLSVQDLQKTVSWVVFQIEKEQLENAWWQRDNLAKIPSIGRNFTYGQTFSLDQYSRDLLFSSEVEAIDSAVANSQKVVDQLETILSRSREANAILVSESGENKLTIIWYLVRRLKDGTINPALRDRRPVLFAVTDFVAGQNGREDFEKNLLSLMSESSRAGNTLLIFDDLAYLQLAATQMGSNLGNLLEPFLVSAEMQVIGLADREKYHHHLAGDQSLQSHFEVVQAEHLTDDELVATLGQSVLPIEARYGLIFTYPALKEIAKSAVYYFSTSASSDKTLDLLLEIAPWAVGQGFVLIDKEQVLNYVQAKTKVPVGTISQKEKDKLLNLKELLSARVVGQKEAISAVASALQRARAGLRSQNRPIGSFLFLGSTGVGKTETAKALAQVFFGGEDLMMRLDMSEYQTADSVTRLIGDWGSGQPGVLEKMLKENPYGVLLLDEFEKTHQEVLNLFLQILDEGFFSNSSGQRISARNIIIVATSNAGADLIWQMVGRGENPAEKQDQIIDYLVNQGIYKPELLNRFDGAIIFQPLGELELKAIAKLMLEKLASRLRDKGIGLAIDELLITNVAKNGSNRVFGARPMQRYIQDYLEQPLSEQIIAGNLTSGQTARFVLAEDVLRVNIQKND